jgi:hypothetical protein
MSDELTPAESAVLVLDEAESLIWALLDEQLEEVETARLAALLEQHESVRRRYIECVQLHIDLQDHFASADAAARRQPAPVLPNLLPGGLTNPPSHVTE